MVLQPLLRRLRAWRATPAITHTLVCGASRSGKSEAELSHLVKLARRGDCAIVLLDPPGSLAAKFLLHLHALGLDDRVLYDRLADTDRVPGYEWLVPSENPDPLQREAENDERVREFAAILLRRRGIQDTARTPLIEEVLLAALELYVCQAEPVPLPWLADVFDLGSGARSWLLANCTEPKLLRKFAEYAALSPTARRHEIAPAERILRAVLQSPAFRVRCGTATFDLGCFLDEKGILILDGSSKGNLSRDATGVMMGAIILRVIEHCRTGSKSKVVLVLDEAVNADLIGVHESRALAEAGKWGLEFRILVQNPFSFPSEEIRSNVLQNCWRHEWFRQGSPEAASLAAEDIAIPRLDPLKLHHTEYRIRTKEVGYELVQTTSVGKWVDYGKTSRSETWQTVLWPRRAEVREGQARYMALQDQVTMVQKALMTLRPGYRFVRGDEPQVSAEYLPMLKGSWFTRRKGSSSRTTNGESYLVRLQDLLKAIKQRPAYHSPSVRLPPWNSLASAQGAVRTLARRREKPKS